MDVDRTWGSTLVKNHDENKTYILVKLSESFSNAIQEYSAPKIKFHGSRGAIKFQNGKSYDFSLERSDNTVECIRESKNKWETVGKMACCLHVKGKDDVYQRTRTKMEFAEQEKRKNCTKLLGSPEHESNNTNSKPNRTTTAASLAAVKASSNHNSSSSSSSSSSNHNNINNNNSHTNHNNHHHHQHNHNHHHSSSSSSSAAAAAAAVAATSNHRSSSKLLDTNNVSDHNHKHHKSSSSASSNSFNNHLSSTSLKSTHNHHGANNHHGVPLHNNTTTTTTATDIKSSLLSSLSTGSATSSSSASSASSSSAAPATSGSSGSNTHGNLSKFPDITDDKQMIRYKAEFDKDFKEYQNLHGYLHGIEVRFRKLKETLKQTKEGSPTWELAKEEIFNEYERLKGDSNFHKARAKYQQLYNKLAHIKKKIFQYKHEHRDKCNSRKKRKR